MATAEAVYLAKPKTKNRLQFIDAVRGLSALAVAVVHTGNMAYPLCIKLNHDLFNLGNFAVAAFFFVSGFVIPMSLEKYGTIGRFWKGRFLRLYPMYWVSLALAWITLGGAAKMYLINITMLQEFLHTPDALGVYWTLELEMVFYVLCSLLFLIGVLRKSTAVAVFWCAGLFLADIGAQVVLHRSLPVGHLAMLGAAFVGSVAYRVIRQEAPMKHLVWCTILLYAVMMHGLWLRFQIFPEPRQILAGTYFAYVSSWTGAFLFFFGFFALRNSHFPAWLTGLGKLTYSLYLLHAVAHVALPLFAPHWLWCIVVISMSIGVSILTYRWIEKPIMRWV